MKPRTKLQVRVFALSEELPELHADQEKWAFKYCLNHEAYRTKTKTACLDCGHVWAGEQKVKICICPGCGERLKISDTRKKITAQKVYFAILDVVDGFQVNRFFDIRTYHKAGKKGDFNIREVVQQWIQPEGRDTVVARNMGYMGSYTDNFHGDLEIRNDKNLNDKFNLYVTEVYPVMKVLPIYKRNGFKGKFGKCAPYDLFKAILKDSKSETLLKADQLGLLAVELNGRRGDVYTCWDSIKIAIRNKYIVKEAITWLDYLELLRFFGKDLRSPKYVCTPTLKAEHDRLVAKKREIERRRADERKRKEYENNEKAFLESKSKYFGIAFSEEDLTIRVLESVKEFMEEGDILKHCVFTNNYFARPNSLILSARIDNNPVETIEIDLTKMKIIQARGFQNKPSEYHDKVLQLLNKNMRLIKKRHKDQAATEVIAA